MIPIDDIYTFSKKVCLNAGNALNKNFGQLKVINNKSNAIDLCTNADIDSEKIIVNAISEKYPHHSILTEEKLSKKRDSDYKWVIDPLDGTTNYIHNLPIFSISIGLRYRERTVFGMVYNPAADKMFYAIKDKGAFLNNSRIYVTSSNTLSESLLATGFPYNHDIYYDLSFSIFKDFYDRTQGIRRLGVASLDLCFVAMGRFDGFYEFNLKPWDICAGDLIAREAGAKCTDWNNSTLPQSGKRILCSNGKIHKEMIVVLNNSDYKIFYDLK